MTGGRSRRPVEPPRDTEAASKTTEPFRGPACVVLRMHGGCGGDACDSRCMAQALCLGSRELGCAGKEVWSEPIPFRASWREPAATSIAGACVATHK